MNITQIKIIIKSNKWYRQACNSKAYYLFAPSRGALDSLNAPGGFMVIREKKYFEWFCRERNFLNKAKWAINKQKRNIHWIDERMKKCEPGMKGLQNFYHKHTVTYINALNKNELCLAVLELESIIHKFWQEIYICDWFDPNGEELLKNEIKKSKINFDTYEVSALLKTSKLNYAQKEQLEFLNLALLAKKKGFNNKLVRFRLAKHAKKYFYLDNSWESTKILSIKDFSNKLKEITFLDTDEIKVQIKDTKIDWEKIHTKIYKKYRVKKELQNVFYLFRMVSYLRDVRKGFTLVTNHYYDILVGRLAKLVNIPFAKFAVCLPGDLQGDLNYLEKRLDERSHYFIEYYHHGKNEIFFGKTAENIYREFQKSFSGEINLIKGFTASPGKIKGLARVVMGETHFGKFNEGEILVAPMTRPEYLPLMKKAAAIITDEGGLTSHAAIIARELRKPCLIGTKIATKILKDGDLIEINTNHNQVKIFKN